MKPERANAVASQLGLSQSRSAVQVGPNVSWNKRYCWAKCQEPYQTTLDSLASMWIECQLTNAEVALEILKLLDELEFVCQPDADCKLIPIDDVHWELKVLRRAILASEEFHHTEQSSGLRRQALDYQLIEAAKERTPQAVNLRGPVG